MELREGPMVNNCTTRSWSVIHTGFNTSEFPDANTYAFGVNDPPEIEPNLNDFAKWLPNYCNDLNAIHEAEKTLTDEQYRKYCNLLEESGYDERGIGYPNWSRSATAIQRAMAYVKTLELLAE